MLGFPILYFKSIRLMMFQLSGFYFTIAEFRVWGFCLLVQAPEAERPQYEAGELCVESA